MPSARSPYLRPPWTAVALLALGIAAAAWIAIRPDEAGPHAEITPSAPPENVTAANSYLRGVVVDRDGVGHADALIQAVTGTKQMKAKANADGAFVMASLGAVGRPVKLSVMIPGAGPGTTLWFAAARDGTAALRVVADPTLRIRGAVRPPPDRDHYVETLLVKGGGTSRQHDTQPDGTFDLGWLAPDVTYSFYVMRAHVGWKRVGTARTGDVGVTLDLR